MDIWGLLHDIWSSVIGPGGVSTVVTNIFNIVNGLLVLKETGGTVTTTGPGTEDDIYINNAPAVVYKPLKVIVDFSKQTINETVVIREYYRISPAPGAALILKDEETFTGLQDPLLKNIEIEPNRYGVRVSMERTAGVAKDYDWCAFYEN